MKELRHFAVLGLVIVAICFVGRFDYNEEVIYNMNESTYNVLKKKLGDVSTSELVDAYMSNREYWDSLGQNMY